MGAGCWFVPSLAVIVWSGFFLTDGVISQIYTHAVNVLRRRDKAAPLIMHCKMSKRMHDDMLNNIYFLFLQ